MLCYVNITLMLFAVADSMRVSP